MPPEAQIAQENDAALAELAQLCLASARDLNARQLAAPEADEAARLAQAFHRVARSVRQSTALRAKLARDLTRAGCEDRQDVIQQQKTSVAAHKAEVRLAVQRLIWDEYERDAADELIDDLDERLDAESTAPDFTATPVEVLVARIRESLGMVPASQDEGEQPDRPEPGFCDSA